MIVLSNLEDCGNLILTQHIYMLPKSIRALNTHCNRLTDGCELRTVRLVFIVDLNPDIPYMY
jgi:hypothetical protein